MTEDDVVDQIYEAAAIPDLWPDVLELLSRRADGTAGALVALTSQGQLAGHISSAAYRSGYEDYLQNGAHYENIRPGRNLERKYPGFLADHEVCTTEELENDVLYARFLRPYGLGWTAGTVVTNPSGDMLVVDIANARGDPPFNRQQMERLDPLRPHLARATLLAARLGLKAARNMTTALGLLGLPAVALGRGGRVVAINALAEALDGRFLFRSFDRLTLASPAADALLAEAVSGNSVPGTVRSIPLPATDLGSAAIVHLIPVRGAANDIFAAVSTIMLVTAVTFPHPPAAELLSGLFDLTPAEARVTRALAEGNTLQQVAQRSGVSLQTVRNQLQAVFGKTGVTRQAELVSLIASSAVFQPAAG